MTTPTIGTMTETIVETLRASSKPLTQEELHDLVLGRGDCHNRLNIEFQFRAALFALVNEGSLCLVENAGK